MKKFLLAFLLLTATPVEAAIVTKEIPYQDSSVSLTGYLTYDDALTAPLPGVLVIHEWWGHNDYVRMRADMLAKLGYVAFVLDMYGTGATAATPEEAQNLSDPFYKDRTLMRSRAAAGLAVLAAQPNVDKDALGVIGYCFGGSAALELARAGADVKAVVSFHGGFSTPMPAKSGDIKAHILALNGVDDQFVTGEEKMGFLKEMTNAHVNFRSIDYPGATHAFTNPQATEMGKKFKMPIAYDEAADKTSWQEMQNFLTEKFKKPIILPNTTP